MRKGFLDQFSNLVPFLTRHHFITFSIYRNQIKTIRVLTVRIVKTFPEDKHGNSNGTD